jgi:hypothetical protein
MTIDESFDVGRDTRSGVDDNDYQPPFRFPGAIERFEPMLDVEGRYIVRNAVPHWGTRYVWMIWLVLSAVRSDLGRSASGPTSWVR